VTISHYVHIKLEKNTLAEVYIPTLYPTTFI